MTQYTISEQLKAWREVRGLSQRALGDLSGVGFVTIARIELAQADPRLSTLARLAKALDIEVVDLLVGPSKAKRPARKRARGK